MGRGSSASTALQAQQLLFFGKHVDATQVSGIFYGYILQTDVSTGVSGPIPSGMMTVHIPEFGPSHVSIPMPYPSSSAPPLGTQVAVGFDSNDNPVAIALYGFSGGSANQAFFMGG